MKANGASGSRRFSARLKCTRPTRFQAGFSAFRKALQVGLRAGHAPRRRPRAVSVPQRPQHIRREILGARHHRRGQHQRGQLAASGGGAISGSELVPADLQAQRRHIARRKPRHHTKAGGSAWPTSAARRSSPCRCPARTRPPAAPWRALSNAGASPTARPADGRAGSDAALAGMFRSYFAQMAVRVLWVNVTRRRRDEAIASAG